MVWLLANWRMILLALTVVGATIQINNWRVDAGKLDAAEKALTAAIAKCESDKKITSEVSRDYQKNLAALRNRIASNRVQPSRCVPVADASAGRDAATVTGVAAGTHGVFSGALLDYAGEAEEYRLRLISCQDFIRRTHESF